MSVDEAGKWLAAAILEQPLFTKPAYQEKVRPPSSDGPLMVLTNVSNHGRAISKTSTSG
jgi:hypothetical protein